MGLPSAWRPEIPASQWRQIVIHHSATASGSVSSIDAEHRRRVDADGKPWLGIGYHFVIGNGNGMNEGQIEPTFRWREQLPGAHAGVAAANAAGIGICLIGNFEDAPPSPQQLAAAVRLTRALATEYNIAPADILRHGELKATDCPGRRFPWEAFHTAVTADAATLE
ncbi:MAG: peptidoglycan recognition protein family protein [Pirellulales bacterium]|nr:peptidoglycan recognition protein family protein [Pirellulales bacterium]